MALGVSNPEPTYDMRSEETQIYARWNYLIP